MTPKKIYIVISSEGQYEEYREKNERAFTNYDDAVQYAADLDRQHDDMKNTGRISDMDMEKARELYYKWWDDEWKRLAAEYGVQYEDNGQVVWTEENIDLQDKVNDELNKQECQKLLEYLTQLFPLYNYTMDDVVQYYINAENYLWHDWHKCKIEEIELYEK